TVETATVGHFKHDVFMDRGIQPLDRRRRVAGVAVTLRIPGPDSALLHHLVSDLRPGDFVVIDRAGDDRHACWGGGVTRAAVIAGCSGAVIDGPITDRSEIEEAGFAIWSRGASPITTKLLALGGAMNAPVSCGGVAVQPGDLILADESGVIVLDPAEAEAVADRALEMQAREPVTFARLKAGERLGDISGASAKVLGG
ncbi:MAG: RraA family protein, partial [Alphaproteobacteria bacterium]